MKKRINRNRIPRTQMDVDRARQHGAEFGMEFALNLVLLVLKDKHDAPDEDIMQLRDEFMAYIDSINNGYLSYADVVNTVHGDYNFAVELKGRGCC